MRRPHLLALLAALPALAGLDGARVIESSGASTVVPAAPETVLVARRDLARGVTLTAADVRIVVAEENAPRRARWADAAMLDARPTLGWVTRRVVREGERLRPPAVAPPSVILAGSPVTVVWEVDGLRLTREGTALGPAQLGDPVIVRLDAQRRVTGTAAGPGLVTAN
jgi:flagella basal body P-ring formation protein FlgA